MAADRHRRFARRWFTLVFPLFLLAGVVALVRADAVENTLGAIVNKGQPRHPVSRAADALYARQQEELAALQSRIDAAAAPEDALRLEREFQAVKIRTERDFLQLQLDHARSIENTAVAAELEKAVAALDEMLARSPRPESPDRPRLGR